MKKRLIITYLFASTWLCVITPSQRTSRVIIYNNHRVTQTVTSSTNESGNIPNQNRFPGHTKNEAITHRVAIKPTPESITPSHSSPEDQSFIIVDNTHTISQEATHAIMNAHSSDPLIPNQSNDLAKKTWLATLIPPIITDSHWSKYVLGSLAIGYLALVAKLIYASHTSLTDADTWSIWQPSITIEHMRLNEKLYAQELFTAIQSRYINAPTNAHFLSPLVYFINDVNTELKKLNAFVDLHKTIDKFKLTFMFPKQENALRMAYEKIDRLEYLKTLMINWVGEYRG